MQGRVRETQSVRNGLKLPLDKIFDAYDEAFVPMRLGRMYRGSLGYFPLALYNLD